MKNALIPVALIGSILVSTSAFAAVKTADGVIKSIDLKTESVTLKGGHTFVFPAKFDLSAFKAGEKVTVTYDMMGKTYEATAIVAR